MDKIIINIVANRINEANSLSGGERIFIELSRRWATKDCLINILTSPEGYSLCKRYKLDKVKNIHLIRWSFLRNLGKNFSLWSSILIYLIRTIEGSIKALKFPSPKNSKVIVFLSSPFWPDVIPGLIMTKRIKEARSIAGFYLFAPNPFKGGYGTWHLRDWLRALTLYINHLPVYYLIKRYTDIIFVTNTLDKKKFINEGLNPDRVIAVQGGVDIKTPHQVPEPMEKRYEAVFIGRFHPQKGVLQLVDIWREVCKVKEEYKLAMIGNGPLEKKVRERIKEYGLQKNIELLGFKDGIEKIKIFKSARVVLHPAVYDSGGMAAGEAMACGLPGVSFDLPALKVYYPKGMVKVPSGDLKTFALSIIRLLQDERFYKEIQNEALAWAKEWSWDERADEVLNKVLKALRWN